MKTTLLLAIASAFLFTALPTVEAAPATYEISGVVSDVRDKGFTLRTRHGGKMEIRYTDSTKVRGKLRKGKRVTVHYMMQAREVRVW